MNYKGIYKCIILILIILGPGIVGQTNNQSVMKQAEGFYKTKNYEKAEESYLQLVDASVEGSSLFYNLGNVYFREGKLGKAILFYNKALKLSPGDEDIVHNLEIANARTVDNINELPKYFIFQWWETILSLFNISGWTYLTYFFFLLLLVTIAIYFMVKKQAIQRISFFTGLIILLLLVISGTFTGVKLNRELNVRNGIIITNVVTVKLSPDENSNDAFVIHEGLKIKLEDKVDNWVKIRLHDGKVGWITEQNIGII